MNRSPERDGWFCGSGWFELSNCLPPSNGSHWHSCKQSTKIELKKFCRLSRLLCDSHLLQCESPLKLDDFLIQRCSNSPNSLNIFSKFNLQNRSSTSLDEPRRAMDKNQFISTNDHLAGLTKLHEVLKSFQSFISRRMIPIHGEFLFAASRSEDLAFGKSSRLVNSQSASSFRQNWNGFNNLI